MATIQTFHLHEAATADTGTLPGSASLSATTPAAIAGGGANRAMDAAGGAGVQSGTIVTVVPFHLNVSPCWLRRWCSAPLSAQTIPAGTWTLSAYGVNSSAAEFVNGWGATLAVWRPSTGARVVRLFDVEPVNPGNSPWAWQPSASGTVTTTYSGAAATIQNGDILVLELTVYILDSSGGGSSTSNFSVQYDAASGNGASTLTAPVALTTFDANNTGGATFTGQANNGGTVIGNSGSTDTHVTLQVSIDWTGGGFVYGDGFKDVSAYCIGFSSARGRMLATDQFGAGQAMVTLRNHTGRFSPYNAASAVYPNLTPGRPVQVRASFQGVTYTLFTGYLSQYTQQTVWGQAAIQFQCLDVLELLRRQIVNLGVQQNQRTDQLLTLLLAAANQGGVSVNAPGWGKTLPLFFQIGGPTALQAIQTLMEQELSASGVFCRKDGALAFNAQSFPLIDSYLVGLTQTEDDTLSARLTDLYSSIQIAYGLYAASTTIAQVYSESTVRALAPGATTFSGTVTTPTTTAPVQPVATTDYKANTATDGTGTDETSQVTVTSWSSTTTGFTITVNNAAAQTVYLTLTLRGTPLVTASPEPTATLTVAAPLIAHQQLQQNADFVQSTDAVLAYAADRVAAFSATLPRPVVQLVGRSDFPGITHAMLGAELENRVALVENTAPHLSNLAQPFLIEHMNLSIQPRDVPRATWQLMSLGQGMTSTIAYTNRKRSTAAGAGAGRSVLLRR